MEADRIYNDYYEGNLSNLAAFLKDEMGRAAELGDIVQLSRLFSYNGAVHLLLGNDFFVSTVFMQIDMEYGQSGNDPRIKASYARFLALYNSFTGNSREAVRYFSEARSLYRQTDWYQDESITLLESLCWHYLLTGDGADISGILLRLQALNHYLQGTLNNDMAVLKCIYTENNTLVIRNIPTLEKLNPKSLSMPVRILVTFILLRDTLQTATKKHTSYDSNFLPGLLAPLPKQQQACPLIQLFEEMVDMAAWKDSSSAEERMRMAKVKAESVQHPWYKDQLSKLLLDVCSPDSEQPVCIETIPTPIQHSAKGISVSLFDKCHMCCGEKVFDINSFKTRTGNELLLYLLTQNNLKVPKEVVVESFFPGETPEKVYNRLYVNIHRLNKVLLKHFDLPETKDFIFIKQGIVCVDMDVIEEIDTQKYRKLLSVANQLWPTDKDAAIDLMQQAVGMYSKNIAPGFYYLDWLEDYRLELGNLQLKALTKMFLYYRERSNFNPCSEVFYSLIELDPLHEDYYIEYIDFLLSDGRSVEAMNLYQQYKVRLKKELGLSPSNKLKNLTSRMMG